VDPVVIDQVALVARSFDRLADITGVKGREKL
jgi:hypothetical protein